jgi:hypothetical protein
VLVWIKIQTHIELNDQDSYVSESQIEWMEEIRFDFSDQELTSATPSTPQKGTAGERRPDAHRQEKPNAHRNQPQPPPG